jgi:hypothetical protein
MGVLVVAKACIVDILAPEFGLLTALKGSSAKGHRPLLHALILLALTLCLVDHVIEGLIGWDQQLLPTGRDTETTLFVVFVLLALAFALVELIHAAKLFRRSEGLLAFLHVEIPAPPFELAIRPDSSPPVPLRI